MPSQANRVTQRRRLGAAAPSLRHPIRSMISAGIAAALATIALVVAASGNNSALAASSLVNGNFETGDLTGWSVDTTASGGDAIANGVGVIFCSPVFCLYNFFLDAKEGSYFAHLTPGRLSEDTIISQTFEASNGDRVSGWAFVHADENNGISSCGSTGRVVIKSDSGETVATPFSRCAYGPSSVLPGGAPIGWQYWEHTFADVTGTGKFTIEARVRNIVDNPAPSVMGLDDVKTSTLDPDADITKPSTSATLSVEPNAAGWNKANLTVRLNATDNQGGSGVQKITYSASGAQSIAQTDTTADSVELNLDQEGTTTLTYYATDKAGNVEDKNSLTIKIDKSAPTGSVTINGGASRTRTRSVTLALSATDPSAGGSGVSQMRISNTQSGLSSAPWEAYSTTKAWTLSSGHGTKTVYVQYRDGAGNLSAVVADTIRFAR